MNAAAAAVTILSGARKVDAAGVQDDFWVVIDGDRIAATGSGRPPERDGADLVDAAGAWLTPGFIDLHGHGGGGYSFDDGEDSIRRALSAHRRHGTTRSVVSLVSAGIDELVPRLAGIARLAAEDPLILGSHLEGPFLSPGRKGAHDATALVDPAAERIDAVVDAAGGTLRQLTLAPELPGALDAIERLTKRGIAVAVGHTEADYDLTRRAFDRGARIVTHAFNAMPGLGHRSPGPVAAAIEDPRVVLELVLDGRHVHPSVARLLFDAAPGRVALITDAMAAAAGIDGEYRLGTVAVEVRDGLAQVAGTDTIAGSTLTQDAALRIAVDEVGLDPHVAVAALTAIPAEALGRSDELGRIAPGYLADLVLLEADWTVRSVWAAGSAIR